MAFKDFYAVLGVAQYASETEIKSAYRGMSKRFHPDVNGGDPYFEERFKEIQEAYQVIGNPVKRSDYDLHYNYYMKGGPPVPPQPEDEHVYEQYDEKSYADSHPEGFGKKMTIKPRTILRFVIALYLIYRITHAVSEPYPSGTIANKSVSFIYSDSSSVSLLPVNQNVFCQTMYDSLTKDTIYTSAETEPENEGGSIALMQAFAKIPSPPPVSPDEIPDISFRVAFVVDKNGQVRGERILHNHTGNVGLQMLKAIRTFKWVPGKCSGVDVPVLVEESVVLRPRTK